MLTVFERIPDLFVQMYDAQFQAWAREFKARGPKQAIRFGRPKGAPVLLDGEGRAIEAGAWLVAEVDRSGASVRVIIRPATEHDQELIARHTREMQPHFLN